MRCLKLISQISYIFYYQALELKRLQTPLYEEFYNSVVLPCSMDDVDNRSSPNYSKLPPKSRSPLGKAVDVASNASPGSGSRCTSNVSGEDNIHSPMDLSSPQCKDITGSDTQQEACSPNWKLSEVQRKWKEELAQELERKREMMRVGGKTGSPIDRIKPTDTIHFSRILTMQPLFDFIPPSSLHLQQAISRV